jgi:hypothetical protein
VWRASGPEQTYIDTGQRIASIALTPSRLTVVNQATDGGVSERSWSLPAAQPGVAIRLGPRAGAWLSPDGSLMTVGPGPNAYGQVGKAPPPFRSPVWSVAQRRVIATLPTTISLSGVEFSHDDRRAAVFDEVEPAIEDIYSARRVVLQNATPCPAGWHSAAFSTDDTALAGADFCGDVYVWNAATGRRLLSFSNGSEIARVTFAPDDDAQLAVGSSDGRITIWSLRTHRPTRILAGHTSGVTSIAYSPIGTLLASNSLDHTTRIWDPSGGRLLRVLHQPDPVHALAFSTDGRTLATGDTQGVVRVWDSCTACGNAQALLAIANRHVFRGLTAAERTTFLGGF